MSIDASDIIIDSMKIDTTDIPRVNLKLEEVRDLLVGNGELRKLYRDANANQEVKKITHHGWIHIALVWMFGRTALHALLPTLGWHISGGTLNWGLIVEIAMLLHDCGLVEGRKSHASNGARKARELLERLNVEPLVIKIICCLVRWHRVEDFLVMAKTINPRQETILECLRGDESLRDVVGHVESSEPFENQDVIEFLALAEQGIPMLIMLALVVLADAPDIGFTRVRGKSLRVLEPCREQSFARRVEAEQILREAHLLSEQSRQLAPAKPLMAATVGAKRGKHSSRREEVLEKRANGRRARALQEQARQRRQDARAFRKVGLDEIITRDRVEISDHDRADFSIPCTVVQIEGRPGEKLVEVLIQRVKRDPKTGSPIPMQQAREGENGLFGHALAADELGLTNILLDAIKTPPRAIRFVMGPVNPQKIRLICHRDPAAASRDFIIETKAVYFDGFKTAVQILGLQSEVVVS